MQTSVVDRRIEGLTELIDSGQFKRAEELICESDGFEDSILPLLQAEIKIYFARLDEAEGLLERVAEQVCSRQLTSEALARYALVRGELHYWRFEYEPAERYFHQAESIFSLTGDTLGWAKAIYDLGRLKRRTAAFDVALQYLDQAHKLLEGGCERNRCDYLKALITHNKAVCLEQLGQLDQADALYKNAIADLKRIELGRHYALALSSYGTLLRRLGRFEESLSVLNESKEILQSFAGLDDMACALNHLALTRIRLGQFDQAEALVLESYQLYERAGNIEHVATTLETTAELYLEKGDAKQAEFYAVKAVEQADLAKNDFEKAQALISLAQAKIRQNDLEIAQRSLEEALEIGIKHQSRSIETATTIYLAESLLTSSPMRSVEYLERGKALLNEYFDRHLMNEFERISHRLNNERVRVTEDNRFVIRGDILPNWYKAKHTMEGFLIKNALRLADGNLTQAAKLLGISTAHAHRYAKKLLGEES